MVDDRRAGEPDPDEPDLDDEDADDRRPLVVTLNPVLERVTWQRMLGIGLMLGVAGAIGFVIYAFISSQPGQGAPSKGLESVVLLVAGLVTIALVLYLGTLILRSLDMGAPGEPLGMPEGSIRALIAMGLILIFAIIGILVFNAGSSVTELVSSGVTQAQIDALRADGAIVVKQTLQTPVPAAPAVPLYDVTTRTAMTQEAHDFGLQLMTTVSTLVVAVAGFYFGSRAVREGSTITQEQLQLARTYSRRGVGVVGAKPEPDAATEEAPGENVEDELGPTEETEKPVDNVDEVQQPEGDEQEPGDGEPDEIEDAEQDLGDLEPPAPDDDDEDGEPPAQNPPPPQP
jgi:hypothetical protein